MIKWAIAMDMPSAIKLAISTEIPLGSLTDKALATHLESVLATP